MSDVKLHLYAQGNSVVYELMLDNNPLVRLVVKPEDAMKVGSMSLNTANVATTQTTAASHEIDRLELDSLPADYPGVKVAP